MRPLAALLLALLANCSHPTFTAQAKSEADNPIVEDRTPKDAAGKLAVAYFGGPVTDKSMDALVGFIEKANDLGVPEIVISIDSPGGYISAGMKLAHAIERSEAPVVCVVDGDAASMAFYLLQACDRRLMTERSRLMVHEPSTTVEGNVHAMAQALVELQSLTDAMARFESARLKVTRAELERHIRNAEWWMGPVEALHVGAVDAVVPSESWVISSERSAIR